MPILSMAADTATPIRAGLDSTDRDLASFLNEKYDAVRRHPLSGLHRGRLGIAYDANGFVREARTTYSQAETLAPQTFHWPYYQAIAAEIAGEHETALHSLARAIGIDDAYGPAWLWRGQIALTLGRYTEAEHAYRRAMDLDTEPFGQTGLAESLIHQKQDSAARELLQTLANEHPEVKRVTELLSARPNSTQTQTHRIQWPDERLALKQHYIRSFSKRIEHADKLVLRHHLDQAIRIFESLSAQRPQHQAVITGLGNAYIQAGLDDAAFALFKTSLSHHPNYVPLHHGLASLYRQRGDDASAIHHLRQALTSQPGESELVAQPGEVQTLELLGFVLMRNGMDPSALDALNAAGSPTAMYYAGMIEGAQGRWQRSIDYFERAIAADPQCAPCYFYMGQSLGEAQRFEEARNAIRRAQTLNAQSVTGTVAARKQQIEAF
jgi:tetratricopeptide (TPR) repeat protein